MLGDTGGAALAAEGTMRVREGGRYDTFTCGEDTYLGTYQLLSARLADGHPLAAVTLVSEGSFRSYARTVRLRWIFGSLAFLAGTLALSCVLSNRFARPITQGLAALQTGGGDAPRSSGISEIDELAAFLQARPQAGLGGLPPEIEAMSSGFAERAKDLKSAATCTAPAVYYKSCLCGEHGDATFTYGEALGHNYVKGTCTRCGATTGGSGGGGGGTVVTPPDPGPGTDPTPGTGFVDVKPGSYYEEPVDWAVEKGITTGTTATTFSPNEDCTRAQIVTFLYRCLG